MPPADVNQPVAAMLKAIERDAEPAVSLLRKLVDQNSGTYHPAGVAAVAAMMQSELQALGFETQLLPGDALQRGPHLTARRKGTKPGKPLLLIGHLDTVFEPASPFQKFVRNGQSATGPGVNDMKGGLVVMVFALKALKEAGLLEGAPIHIFLTGDEEAPGTPVAAARRAFIAEGKLARAALCFPMCTIRGG